MRRRLLDLLTALSLLLCVAVAALWVRSYWVGDVVAYHGVDASPDRGRRETRSWMVASADGDLTARTNWSLDTGDFVRSRPARAGWSWAAEDYPANVSAVYHLELRGYAATEYDSLRDPLVHTPPNQGRHRWKLKGVTLPHWALAAALLLPPLMTFVRFARRRFRRSRYLRATPGRCPECGTAATAPG